MKDITAGIFFISTGAFFLFHGINYRIGTLDQMGPGFFPVTFSIVSIVLGAVILVRELVRERH